MTVATEPIHTLADLEHWSFPGPALAVVGRPVAHSLSPAMHNAALAALADTRPEFAAWRYFKFDVAPADLPEALGLFHCNRFVGLNLTVPHKTLAISLLDSADDFVRAAGAANTLSVTATGWQGANTDGTGLIYGLREEFGASLAGAHVVLLGAGGAARGAAVACLREGCASLWIGNRTSATLQTLVADLRNLTGTARLHPFDLGQPPADLPAGSIVINATSLGLANGDASPLDLKRIARPACVYDMIYRPPHTALLRQALGLGLRHANGLSMLVHQGARSLELWTQAVVPVGIMQAAARAALGPN